MKLLLSVALLTVISAAVHAQFPYSQTFKAATAPGLVIAGSAKLTSGAADPAGDGYLRLTENTVNNVGYVYGVDSFPSTYGLTASFEFFTWKTGATSSNQGDGMTFFLFDAGVNSFRPGGVGGSLGYANYYTTPGMAKGYMGIAIDEFGNFSSNSDGNKTGSSAPGQVKGSVAIRGPGDGAATTANQYYAYQTGVDATPTAVNFRALTQRYPDSASANYRRIRIIMTPNTPSGYKVTVILYKGGTVPCTPVTLISDYVFAYAAPSKLRYGLTASTGSNTCYHEIRNLSIEVTNASTLTAPTLGADAGVVACQGQTALLDLAANDASTNSGGSINRATVDLDPSTAGIQTTWPDPGKGSYSVDASGILTFTPVSGYSGTSTATYSLKDNYGISATTPGTITITVNSAAGPSLALNNPSAVCSPSTVNITDPSLRTAATTGATYSYYSSLTGANSSTGAITGTALSVSGTYYVRADYSGCGTVKPVTVKVDAKPTTASAGSNQNLCLVTGGSSTTLLAGNPDIGTGAWTQTEGPATGTITFPAAATSPLYGLSASGTYKFQWAVSNGACAVSSSVVTITVAPIASAGSAQSFANATSATLAGNNASPGTGAWTVVSGSGLSFGNTASATTMVSGLVPGNSYTLQWKVSNSSGCNSTSQVVLTDVLNTIANAGTDRTVASGSGLSLGGNSPDAGNTGTWALVSAPSGASPAFTSVNSPTTGLTGMTKPGSYTFRWTMVNGSFSNADDVVIALLGTLPVRLLSFSGSRIETINRVSWSTASELDNLGFAIERSADGHRYEAVGFVMGANTSNNRLFYHYDDQAPAGTVWYYRLKQEDIGGAISYSGIVRLQATAYPRISLEAVYPNPAQGRLQVLIAGDGRDNRPTLQMVDAAGRLLNSTELSLPASGSVSVQLSLAVLPSGQYWLRLLNQGIVVDTISFQVR